MKKITTKQVAELRTAQEKAVRDAQFWAYPGEEWQSGFQAQWLESNFGTSQAQGPDGLVWGVSDE